ncbi:MAG: M50 family metallopeptidase [Phycisphaeraceae bacterium]
MFGRRFHLFTLFGFPVYLDLSWFIILVLVTWSLAEGVFGNDEMYPGLVGDVAVRWTMGIIGALGLFASVLLHELGHAKVAEARGLPMRGITLFIFGGVAEMSDEPPSAKTEFLVAVAGPIVSILIGAVLGGIWFLGKEMTWPLTVTAVVGYVSVINFVLVGFNIIPAFPLDGGRVLRSIIWQASGKLEKATRITSAIGSGFAFVLMGMAILFLITGNLIAALWWFLIGLFLRGAAQGSYQRLILRRALEGEPVHKFMNDRPVTVPPDATIDRVVHDYLYRYHFKMLPVVEGEQLQGCLLMSQVKQVPREQWEQTRVADVVRGCEPGNTIDADDDALNALSRMNENQVSRLMVLEDGRLVGVISLKDLMSFLSMKVELEEDRAA